MRRRALVAGLAILGIVLAVALAPAASAQEGGGDVPTRDIIPEPGSGEAPDEAGDRGGSLQLVIFGIVVVAILGGAASVAHQSRRARSYSPTSARIASQADTPSMKPER